MLRIKYYTDYSRYVLYIRIGIKKPNLGSLNCPLDTIFSNKLVLLFTLMDMQYEFDLWNDINIIKTGDCISEDLKKIMEMEYIRES